MLHGFIYLYYLVQGIWTVFTIQIASFTIAWKIIFISQNKQEAFTFNEKNGNQFLAELKTPISVDLSFIILSEVWINSEDFILNSRLQCIH